MKKLLLITLGMLIAAGCGRSVGVAVPQSVTVTKTERTLSGEGWKGSVAYPIIKTGNAKQEQAVNEALKAFAEGRAADFSEQAKALVPPSGASYENEFTLSYEPYLINNRVASVLWSDYRFTGGAHGGTTIIPFTYDIENGTTVSLADLFLPASNYAQQLSIAARTELKEKNLDLDPKLIDQGTEPIDQNFSAFALDQDALTVMFQQYQVGPYAAGNLSITIPFGRLEKILNRQLLDRLLLIR